jgi:hypothetical protein
VPPDGEPCADASGTCFYDPTCFGFELVTAECPTGRWIVGNLCNLPLFDAGVDEPDAGVDEPDAGVDEPDAGGSSR